MVSRVPPPEGGSTNRAPRTSSGLVLLLVLAVVAGTWLLSGRGPGADTSVATDETSASAPAPSSSPIRTATPSSSGSSTTEPQDPGRTATPSLLPEQDPTPQATAPPKVDPDSGLPTIYLLDLPPEAAETVDSIDDGPPYAYDQDGGTFGNYEGLLPDRERGYYQEFTVETPGSYDRGARRIIEGADGELYWTDDHYGSFSRILL